VLVVSLLLPEQYQFILPVLQVPLLIITRVPQVGDLPIYYLPIYI